MSTKISGISVTRKSMDDLARQIFKAQVPAGYVMNDDQIDFVFGAKDIDFMINLLPEINKSEIKNLIAGKGTQAVKTILSQKIPGFDDIQIKNTPNLFSFLPHVPDNISIVVEAK